MSERQPKPMRIRELRAEMELKEISLRRLRSLTGIPYTTLSEILNGKRVDPLRLSKLSKVIKSLPTPQEVAA